MNKTEVKLLICFFILICILPSAIFCEKSLQEANAVINEENSYEENKNLNNKIENNIAAENVKKKDINNNVLDNIELQSNNKINENATNGTDDNNKSASTPINSNNQPISKNESKIEFNKTESNVNNSKTEEKIFNNNNENENVSVNENQHSLETLNDDSDDNNDNNVEEKNVPNNYYKNAWGTISQMEQDCINYINSINGIYSSELNFDNSNWITPAMGNAHISSEKYKYEIFEAINFYIHDMHHSCIKVVFITQDNYEVQIPVEYQEIALYYLPNKYSITAYILNCE